VSHQFDLAGMARLRQTVDHGHVDHQEKMRERANGTE
jgi:hypothetical protein